MPLTPFLAPHACGACGLTYLHADTFLDDRLPVDGPIRISPFLLEQSEQAKAILAGIPLFHIELTKQKQYVCRRFFYDMPPKYLAAMEKTQWRRGARIGIAALHVHRHDPVGMPIPDLNDYSREKDNERIELYSRLAAERPDEADWLHDLIWPPMF